MPQEIMIDFRKEISDLAALAQQKIEEFGNETGSEIRRLVLEEISGLSPFPQVDVGYGIYGNNFIWDGKRKKIDGILVLTSRQSGSPPHLGNYLILRPDRLCWYGIFFNDEPELPNVDFFKDEGGGKPASAGDYLRYQEPIVDAVERAKPVREGRGVS